MIRPILMSPMHLTHDETEDLPTRAGPVSYRVRVWMRSGKPPVVVIKLLEGVPAPSSLSKLASLVWECYLHYLEGGMHFFVTEADLLYRVTFEGIGPTHRMKFTNPDMTVASPVDLFSMLGQQIEL